jgi:hypothetical protein
LKVPPQEVINEENPTRVQNVKNERVQTDNKSMAEEAILSRPYKKSGKVLPPATAEMVKPFCVSR